MNPAPSPPLPPRSAARIFRKAAERIASNRNSFCCLALSYAGASKRCHDLFSDLFEPKQMADFNLEIWWDYDEKEPRLLALLLCATIIEQQNL